MIERFDVGKMVTQMVSGHVYRQAHGTPTHKLMDMDFMDNEHVQIDTHMLYNSHK